MSNPSNHMKLAAFIARNEDWLIDRVLHYAKRHNYVKYTSTLREAWRMSIQGLSIAVSQALESHESIPELDPDEDLSKDPITAFGIMEAHRHRERGVNLPMFLGLFKYYHQSYEDLLGTAELSPEREAMYARFIRRVFDRIEIGFCDTWLMLSGKEQQKDLERANRSMTNEKNKFLTVVESLAHPVILLDMNRNVEYINNPAAVLFGLTPVPGAYYYNQENMEVKLPSWLQKRLHRFYAHGGKNSIFEYTRRTTRSKHTYIIAITAMLDVSEKFAGAVVALNDITDRKHAEKKIIQQRDELEKALAEIKTLRGIIPICSQCKKIRDDKGYWEQVEVYIEQHSDALFSHGLCPLCVKKMYPRYASELEAEM